jgi:hypothetical protein
MTPTNFYKYDSWLNPFAEVIEGRIVKCLTKEKELTEQSLSDFASGHHYYGLHMIENQF